MKYFIGKIPTSKGNKWFLFKGSSESVVLDAQILRGHPVIEGTFKELSVKQYYEYKRVFGFKTLGQ